jgi:hypothetical protein
VGSRTGVYDVKRRKILPLSGLELQSSAVQPVSFFNLANFFIFIYLTMLTNDIRLNTECGISSEQ